MSCFKLDISPTTALIYGLLLSAGLAAIIGATGCATSPAERLAVYNSTDKVIVDKLVTVSSDGTSMGLKPALSQAGWTINTLSSSDLRMKKKIAGTWGPYAKSSVIGSVKSFDTDPYDDAIARAYFSAARERGNTVKLYSNKLTKSIFNTFGCPFCSNLADDWKRWYRDGVLIELDSTGRFVSVVYRAIYYEWYSGYVPNMYKGPATADAHYYVTIVYGPKQLGKLRNTIPQRSFSNTFIRDIVEPPEET